MLSLSCKVSVLRIMAIFVMERSGGGTMVVGRKQCIDLLKIELEPSYLHKVSLIFVFLLYSIVVSLNKLFPYHLT